jgi:hypothetical protein
MSEKITYEYDPALFVKRVGTRVLLAPISHPHKDQENLTHILTSPVVDWNPHSGVIETDDAIYKPIKE